MKYIITESQFLMIRFRRRLEEFDEYIKENEVYLRPCVWPSSEGFIGALQDELLTEIYDFDDVADKSELISLVHKYISEIKGPALRSYYESKCPKNK